MRFSLQTARESLLLTMEGQFLCWLLELAGMGLRRGLHELHSWLVQLLVPDGADAHMN